MLSLEDRRKIKLEKQNLKKHLREGYKPILEDGLLVFPLTKTKYKLTFIKRLTKKGTEEVFSGLRRIPNGV